MAVDILTLCYWDYVALAGAPQPGWPNNISYRHSGDTRFLWTDGHIESTKENTIGHQSWFR